MDDNRCPEGYECPVCTESDIDNLLIDEDESILCVSCNTRYRVVSGKAIMEDAEG